MQVIHPNLHIWFITKKRMKKRPYMTDVHNCTDHKLNSNLLYLIVSVLGIVLEKNEI